MTAKPRIVCIDDEPQVLAGIALNLRRDFEVLQATSGEAGLELLAKHPDVAVVMSDMRMPKLDGAATLARAHDRFPEVSRILLTGQADMASAANAINQGQIFRFLTKPCEPAKLVAALQAAVAQHRLVTAERVLLQSTLRGAVDALADVLAIASPMAFGRANRVKQRAIALATAMELPDRWALEIAATMEPLGMISLPHETLEHVHAGFVLSAAEQKMVARVPEITEQLLAHIPRLEPVRDILAIAARTTPPRVATTPAELAANVLRVAEDLEALETSGVSAGEAIAVVRGRAKFDDRVVAAAGALLDRARPERVVLEVALDRLHVGMEIAADLHLSSGALLVPRGYEVSASFIARIRNFPEGAVRGPIRVSVENTFLLQSAQARA